MLRYLLFLALVTIGVSLIITQAALLFPAAFAKDYVTGCSLYFFLLTAVFHYGLVRAAAGKPAVFIRYYMGASTFKLFIHLGVLVGFAFLHREALFSFAITFMTYYLLFTVFEVIMAFRQNNTAK